MPPLPILDDLRQRGLLHSISSPELEALVSRERISLYIGFDPTAPSLHVGSMIPLLGLMRWQRAGHRPIALVGGGTGVIGDPSGKTSERSLQAMETISANVAALRAQMGRFLDFGKGEALLVDNNEWLGSARLLPFLRDIGKHFSVNAMLDRDAIKTRLETREQGISYTEFSYLLLQAYDFLELFDRHRCILQMGGSDQWGNILSGVDLIRRLRGGGAWGAAYPLLLKADGSKFGKSESGSVWLDPEMTGPFSFYQFWINSADADVVKLLNWFTFLSHEEIGNLEAEHRERPDARRAQTRLAEEVTRMVHGDEGVIRAQKVTRILFGGGDLRALTGKELVDGFAAAPRTPLPKSSLGGADSTLVALLASTGLCASRGRAREDITQGAISVNGQAIRDMGCLLSVADVLDGGFIVLRRGKKAWHVLAIED